MVKLETVVNNIRESSEVVVLAEKNCDDLDLGFPTSMVMHVARKDSNLYDPLGLKRFLDELEVIAGVSPDKRLDPREEILGQLRTGWLIYQGCLGKRVYGGSRIVFEDLELMNALGYSGEAVIVSSPAKITELNCEVVIRPYPSEEIGRRVVESSDFKLFDINSSITAPFND